MRTDRLQKEYIVELRWRVFPLHPKTPEEGIELSKLFAGREDQLKDMQGRLRDLAATEGLPLSERTITCNSRRAQELGKWAEEQGKGDSFRQAVYRAYFVEGRNIALMDELIRIVEAIGLPGSDVQDILETRRYAPAVDADWQRAMGLGITAVPTHLCEERRLVGFGSYEDFLRLIGKG